MLSNDTEYRETEMLSLGASLPEDASSAAIKASKAKTGAQNTGHALASSRMNATSWGRAQIFSVYAASNVIGRASLIQANAVYNGGDMPGINEVLHEAREYYREEYGFDEGFMNGVLTVVGNRFGADSIA